VKPRLQYKTLPTRIVSMDGRSVRPEPVAEDDPYADLAALSLRELKAYADATIKHLGVDTTPPIQIRSFEC
jgi:hypothetical protein